MARFDPRLLLHGQQYIQIHKPLPPNACVSISGKEMEKK